MVLDGRRAGAGQTDSLELPENQVHLWVADHRVRWDELDSYAVLLDAGESERASRFRFRKDFRRFVFGHARVRSILALYTGIPPDALHIARRCAICGSEEHGKPYLRAAGAPSPIRFGCSYSDELFAVAVSNGAEVGIDVERVVARFAWREVADTALSAGERALLEELDDDAAAGAFYDLWTRKEAVAKVSGRGLDELTRMDTCEWTSRGDREFELAGRCIGTTLDLPGHAAAVAVEGVRSYEWCEKERPGDLQSLDKGA